MTIHDQVFKFMSKVPTQDTPNKPIVPSMEIQNLRSKLINEEFIEYATAVVKLNKATHWEEKVKAWAEIADALADLHYVVAGAGVAFGLPMNEVQDKVHEANMAKFGPGSWVREDGKQMKPPDWEPPDHTLTIQACFEAPSGLALKPGGGPDDFIGGSK